MPLKPFHKSKLFDLLRTLTPLELNRFGVWLESHWPDHSVPLEKLYQLILPYFPEFQAEGCTRENIYQALFPLKKEPDFNRLSTLVSALYSQLEAFLVHEKLHNDQDFKAFLLSRELANRGQHKWAGKNLDRLIVKYEAQPVQSWEDWLQLEFLYERRLREPPSAKINRPNQDDDLLKANSYLDRFYKLGKYRFLLELAERETILEEDHQLSGEIEILKKIAPHDDQPVFQLYQKYLDNRTLPPKANFEELKGLFLENFEGISAFDQSILLLFLINVGARARLTGHTEVLPELLDFYKLGLEKQLLLYDGQLTASTFSNIVTIGNLQADFNYVEQFIQQYSKCLPKAVSEDALYWAQTHLAFYSKNSRLWKVATRLRQNKSVKSAFVIRGRVLQIQMWVEDFIEGKSKDSELILSLCHSFRQQLLKSKIYSPKRLAALRNFVKYTRKLVWLIDSRRDTPIKLQAFHTAINEEQDLHAKTWLLQQLWKRLRE